MYCFVVLQVPVAGSVGRCLASSDVLFRCVAEPGGPIRRPMSTRGEVLRPWLTCLTDNKSKWKDRAAKGKSKWKDRRQRISRSGRTGSKGLVLVEGPGCKRLILVE